MQSNTNLPVQDYGGQKSQNPIDVEQNLSQRGELVSSIHNNIKPQKQKKGWLNRNIFGMGLASFFSDWNHEMASAVLPLFLSSVLGAPAFALGVIEGVADGVSTIFEILAGWYSDRIGKRKGLAAVGYFITAFSKASFALATTWFQVLIGRTGMDRLVNTLSHKRCAFGGVHKTCDHRACFCFSPHNGYVRCHCRPFNSNSASHSCANPNDLFYYAYSRDLCLSCDRSTC
jgi:hypothetical protein